MHPHLMIQVQEMQDTGSADNIGPDGLGNFIILLNTWEKWVECRKKGEE